MFKRACVRWLGLVVVVALVLGVVPGAIRAEGPPLPVEFDRLAAKPPVDLERVEEVPVDLAMSKIDPALRDAAERGGKELVSLYVAVQEGTDLSKYLSKMIARPALLGKQNVYGQTPASNLLPIAQEPKVLALVSASLEMRDKPYNPEIEDAPSQADLRARMEALRAGELSYAETQAMGDVGAQGWFDVLDGHKSKEAWEKGFTGQGVVVGVLDDGIDFGHPDLQGTAARVTDPASPYYGWPMAFSQVSTLYFVQDIVFGVSGIASGWGGSRWTDAQTTVEAHGSFEGGTATVTYQPLGSGIAHEYAIPTTSQSSFYKLGSFPERNLLNLYGERVAVLVVDEGQAGVYDTVYVDLDNDYDFSDEKPATKASPEIYRDMDGDGYADISGGILVWVSDGAHPPPTADWLWGITCADASSTMKGCPDPGELVLFAGPFDAGYTHGTNCASNVAGQGAISGGLSAQPFRVGGMVQGGAPDVGLMDFGNHYYTGTDEDEFLVAALGYDGVPNSGDEVQIASNSYGNFRQMWGGWGYIGRLITALNNTLAPTTVWLFSSGNEGPGYGPQEGDGSPTTIQVGSSTQYGSTNWDSISGADQIMYGDPNSYFAKGPNRDGSSGLDVLASGGFAAGSEGINYYGYNGAESWATWGGTSRSSPVAAGNLALVYEAFKARNGRWPTWSEAKALLKSGATDSVSSPFFQGAGVVNADRSTDLAAGLYGVYATPDEWQVGDWEGVEYLNFAKVAEPGETFAKTYTLHNPSGYGIRVGLSDGVMKRIGSTELSFTTSDESEESSFNFHSPDYLMELDESMIPADAEVMIVRYVHPYSTFDPVEDFAPDPNSSWRFLLYNWTDVNGDGKLWTDRDGNGVVNHVDDIAGGMDNDGFFRPDYSDPGTEIQEGEYVRVDYEFGGLAVPIMVRDPLARMADGYFFGWQHRSNDGSVATTTLKIGVEFYKRADWEWLTLSTDALYVPAEGSATFEAVAEIPSDAAPGAYEGVIFVTDPGDINHGGHETALPVVVNVIADLADGGSPTLGGEATMADTMYQNSWTYGYFNWYGGGWTGAGDWRHYFLNVDDADVQTGNLLIHTAWQDVPTDINTWVLGPTDDCASNGTDQCAWYQPGLGQPNPAVYGPYTLQPIGGSEPFRSGAAYPFHTSTGGPDDWLLVPLERAGLHEIALHNVLYNGEELAEQFQVDVGTIAVEAVVDPAAGDVSAGLDAAKAYAETGAIEFQFTPTLELPDLEATLTGGLATTHYGPFTAMVPDTGQCYSAWCPGNVYEPITVDTPGATLLETHLYMQPNQDADFFLVYDANDNGVPEEGTDPVVGSSGNSSGSDEHIAVVDPDLGRYFAVIDGYDVDPDAGVDLDWDYHVTAPGALPSYPVDAFDAAVTIDQDAPLDPTSASFTTMVTTSDRVAALNVELTGIPAGADVDVYISDDTGEIVAMAQSRGNADEEIRLVPPEGEYRFEAGVEYAVWVHGYDVPAPVTPNLHVWWDVNSLWLSAAHPDVRPNAIGEGETVSLVVNWEVPGWVPGEHPHELSARVLAGPSVLPGAFDELVILEREDPPGLVEWNPANLDIVITADSDRGVSPSARWNVGGAPISTALVAAGEQVVYSVQVTNMDALDSPVLIVDAWPLPEDYIGVYFGFPDRTDGVDYALIDGTAGTMDYGGGIGWAGVLPSGTSVEFSYWVEMPADMALGGDHTSGVDVYDYFAEEWLGWDLAGGYYRAATLGLGGIKASDPPVILAGDTFDYGFTLVNYSAEDVELYLSDVLPAEVAFNSATGGAAYDAGSHTVTWVGEVAGTTKAAVEFDLTVESEADLPFGTVIENVAKVSAKFDGPALGTLAAYTGVGSGADLEIEKTVDILYGSTGDALSFQIVFGNTGVETAKNLMMKDKVPLYLDVVPGSVSASEASAGMLYKDGMIQWMGDVAPGAEVTVSFQATIDAMAPSKMALINAAHVMADNYPLEVMDSSVTEVASIRSIYLPIISR